MSNLSVPHIPQSTRRATPALVRQFTPNWFAASMGTGILALGLAQFPASPLLHGLGEVLWTANIMLFATFAVLLASRFLLHFDEAQALFAHPVLSMFFGCIPMALATIVNGLLIFGVPRFGAGAVTLAELGWWIDVGLAFACGLAIPYAMFTRQAHAIERMTAVWLLPLVASEVAAVSGGLLLPHLAATDQLTVLVTSLLLWACSVPIALSVLVLLFLRMALHKLPEAGMAASSWLSIGPIGTGALALAIFSETAPAVLSAQGLGPVAAAFSGAALLGALLLWGYGLWWLSIAIAVTLRYASSGIPFNLGWWGYTFPLGVYALSTLRLSHIVPFAPFALFGTLLVGLLAIIWLCVAARTLIALATGGLGMPPAPAVTADYTI
jgi:C4-dicarboxylate transporter/malic acid transport protein